MWEHGLDMDDNECIVRSVVEKSKYLDGAYVYDRRDQVVQALALTAIASSLATIARLMHQGYTQP